MTANESHAHAAGHKIDLPGGTTIWTLTQDQSSHLVVRHGRSVLVDCHTARMDRWLQFRKLPSPDLILHTHVQPEHCCESDLFPNTRILVHQELAPLAGDPEDYRRTSQTTWDDPADWANSMGRERYGVAGSITQLPPGKPLKISGTFVGGDVIEWEGLAFHVVDLPGHGRFAVGFLLKLGDKPLAFFTGDLFRAPACLVNVYDLENTYGGTALPELPAVLRKAAAAGVDLFFPSTGGVMPDGAAQARELADKIDVYHKSLEWTSGKFKPAPQPECPQVGRYHQVHEGVFQKDSFGNCILFIDRQGRGMMVDPGPCDYENPKRKEDFIADLKLFEEKHGLKSIDLILVTHFHGDHYDLAPLVTERYPGCRVAAWDLVARVIEAPWSFPYAARLPWYNMGVEHIGGDDVLLTGQPYFWHGVSIGSGHLPGHCHAHGVYWLTFNGKRFAITGDTIQARGDTDRLNFIISNDSVPGENSGCVAAYRTVLKHEVDMNLGGHGSRFVECRAQYEESLRRMEHALPYLRVLIPDGNFARAFKRPWFPVMEPVG